jgi:acyl carrier protein
MPRVPDDSEVTDLIMRVASTSLEVDTSEVTLDTRLDSIGMDSLAQLELVTALEDELSVRIPDEAIEQIQTVGQLVRCFADLQRSGNIGQPDSAPGR